MKKVIVPFLMLLLVLFAFMMCSPTDGTDNPTDDGGDGGGAGDGGDSGDTGDGGDSGDGGGSAAVYTLTVRSGGEFGNVSISPKSSAGLPDGTYFYDTDVTLTARGIEKFSEFLNWSGDVNSSEREIIICIDANKAVTVTFGSLMEKREMIPVTGGTYTQQSNSGQSFSHTISGFSIGKYEVTYELWHAVYEWATSGDHGYHFQNAGLEGWLYGGYPFGRDPTDNKYHPVTLINWRDCIVWCNAYSEMMGLKPVYIHASAVLRDSRDDNGTNCNNATCDWSANGYRLPTEGEWQFAASNRGATNWIYASGATNGYFDDAACDEVAWYRGNSDLKTHPVGEKKANGLGLHDMSGNVWEVCWDEFAVYPSSPKTDYSVSVHNWHVISRGGSSNSEAKCLSVGFREGEHVTYIDHASVYTGFRLVRRP